MKTDTYPGYDRHAVAPGLAYVCEDGHLLCCACANRKNGSLASLEADTDPQWRIVGSQFLTDPETCAHCYADIEQTKPALIAAAPDLLAALIKLEAVESSPHSETTRYLAREQAREAIAKATLRQ